MQNQIAFHKVSSSQISEIGHDASTEVLAVRFNTGALYHYTGVSAEKFAAFKGAESVGSYFGKHIKGTHDYTKVPEKKKEDK